MELWEKYGTGPNDPTTREEREKIGGLMLGIAISFNYKEIEAELKERKKDKVSYDELIEIMEKIKKDQILDMINY